jgi:hypothetical protein
MGNKNLTHAKIKGICCQKLCLAGNVKRSSSERRNEIFRPAPLIYIRK